MARGIPIGCENPRPGVAEIYCSALILPLLTGF